MLRTVGLLAVILAIAACSSRPPDESGYLKEIAAVRAANDTMMRASGSPISADKRSQFLPLAYFPVDPSYAVPAAFRENPPTARPRMQMDTSAHEPRLMELLGVLEFTLQGTPLRLSAFAEVGQSDDRLFVPFTDATTGSETYRAGRYLEIGRSSTGIYVVDFNRAFNPYCYYNPTYDCPYPPKENRLAVAIRAGEKVK
ncbi:MAG TPA: DUF1684 domain-containing protein [Vicinamibacterales bacterium]|jgi:hypothetical protein